MLIITSIEVILISKIGTAIGFFSTFIIIIATAMLGSWLLKKQWRFVTGKLSTLQQSPSQAVLEAMILLICGVLLITPGFLTDIVGFLGLIPSIRTTLVSYIAQRGPQAGFQFYTRHQHHSAHRPFEDSPRGEQIIEGEFEKKSEP